jgi:hypothetical protein
MLDTTLNKVDARTHYKPEKAKELIQSAINVVKSRAEVARRCGCSDEYLRLVMKGERKLNYGLQVTLEVLILTDTP